MPTNITISGLSGSSPFDVYVCDPTLMTCVYVSTITPLDLPYFFEIPGVFSTLSEFFVKVVDSNDCIIAQDISI